MSVVPDSVVTFLLDNVTRIIKDKYDLIAGVEDKFKVLQEKVQTLKSHMQDFVKHNNDSDFVQNLVERIRVKVNEAKDAVDTYVVLATIANSSLFGRFKNPKKLHDAALAISAAITNLEGLNKDVRDGIRKLQERKLNHDLPANTNAARAVEERNVIGFEEAANDVRRLLTGGPEQFGVVSIVGMLGLGKTTLARKVFNDLNVDGSPYNILAFVPVSRCSKKDVLLEILSEFAEINDEVRKMTEKRLERHLHDQLELEQNQFLIVLDDVCEKQDWEELKNAFPTKKKKRCRVLITTRNDEVAERVCDEAEHVGGEVYELRFLPLDKSRELLRWKVFNDNNCRDNLKEHEETIAKKCDGLPMAIVAIADVFTKKDDSYDSWYNKAVSVNGHIAEKTKNEIEQMYMCLEKHLKLCFLYLGIFPENSEIPVWKLVRLWIAEGLIEEKRHIALEDTAEQYLEEFVRKHLVIVAQRRSNGKPKTCRLHNIFREFCREKAKEEYFFHEIERDESSKSPYSALDYFHAICINNANNPACSYAVPSGKGVRSFFTFAKEETTTVSPAFVSSIPKNLEFLRVLEMQSPIPTTLSNDFSNLVLLKYAAIYSDFSKLPWETSQMRDMETLIVNTTSPTLEIKADILKTPYLRHLHTNASAHILHPDAKKDKLKETLNGKNLRTLSTIAPESCRKDVFDQAPELRKLGIRGELAKLFKVDGQSNLSEHLKQLKRLGNLKLLNETSGLYELPLEKSCAEHLTKLTLSKTLLKWSQMSTIADLEKLEVLKLKDNAFRGTEWKAEKKDFRFPNLKELQISGTHLADWEASKDNFPNLKCLKLKRCDMLGALPRCLAYISDFQLVVLDTDFLAKSAYKLQALSQRQAQTGKNNSIFKVSLNPYNTLTVK